MWVLLPLPVLRGKRAGKATARERVGVAVFYAASGAGSCVVASREGGITPHWNGPSGRHGPRHSKNGRAPAGRSMLVRYTPPRGFVSVPLFCSETIMPDTDTPTVSRKFSR